ncbi:unnamed protein product [Amoebophrya sp. A120]|nr:unnamed protein product [Amoebophrya sp. A120]|eukprot:GSA120T00004452001.1
MIHLRSSARAGMQPRAVSATSTSSTGANKRPNQHTTLLAAAGASFHHNFHNRKNFASASAGSKPYKVGILGASGAVGTRFVSMLEHHPWFDIIALGGGPNEVGHLYRDVADKVYNACLDPKGIPPQYSEKKLLHPDPAEWKALGVNLVFSAVPDHVAKVAEYAFAEVGIPCFSNSPENRMGEKIPLLQPYVNPEHMMMAKTQDSFAKSEGFVATNPNCSTIAMTVGLKPLVDKFGIEHVNATTLQAISGSGFPGLSHAEMYDNCVPYIGNEEEKMEEEAAKILGSFDGSKLNFTDIKVSAICNRVPVSNGHMICVSVKLKNKPANLVEECNKAFDAFTVPEKVKNCPSCPEKPIRLFTQETRPDRPQHRLDRDYFGGMGVNVGRVRPCHINDVKFTILGHNTVIGAAGGSILNAELAVNEGLIKKSG